MKLIDFLTRSLTWWNGQTWGTYWTTRRHGTLVGTDELGNSYYRGPLNVRDPSFKGERRWVVYNGEAEASRVPPGWRGWLTHTYNTPPSEQSYAAREWEKSFVENRTGSMDAYRPQGSAWKLGERPAATGDYVAWSPDSVGDPDVPRPSQHPGTHGVGLEQRQSG